MSENTSNNSQKTLVGEIIQEFFTAVEDEKIFSDETIVKNFKALFEDNNLPSVDQIKQVLFNEEIP